MKKHIFLSILLYFFIFLLLAFLVYNFISDDIEIVFSSLLLAGVSLLFGFMLSFYVLKQKFKIDENVLHLTKEILHELALPLATIKANSLLLKRTLREDEKSLKRLGRIDDSSVRLERLYDELIYSIKKEIKSVDRERVDVKELVEKRIETMKLLHRNSFVLELESHVTVVDRIGFEKMFDNILTNAMKYSNKESEIVVTLNRSILSVADKGIGMDEMELLGIYERYFQLNDKQEGQGIGLALVKAYCDDEKIKVNINSKKNIGTIVTLDLTSIVI